MDRRQLADLDRYLNASDESSEECKRPETKHDKDGDELRVEWEEWIARNMKARKEVR